MARAMKNSGYDWIGQVPDSWLVLPAQRGFTEIKRKNTDGAVQKALQFKAGTIIPKVNFDADNDDYVAETITAYTVVEPGTVMINGLNLNYDFKTQRSALVKERGVITSAYLALQPDTVMITPEFATYLFKGYETKMALHNMGSGIRLTLGWKEFKKQPVLFPPIQEQECIVRFLDRRCYEIDLVIAETQRSIEEYKKLKQSIITEAVTKGVRGKRTMKDSGIEWIGMIPANWEIIQLKHLCDFKTGGTPPHNDGINFDNDGYQWVTASDMNETLKITDTEKYITGESVNKCKYKLFPKDSILLACIASVGKMGITNKEVYSNQQITALKPYKDIVPLYLLYQLKSMEEKIVSDAQSNVVPIINTTYLRGLKCILPSQKEQKEIANYLDNKCSQIDSIIADKKKQLELLEVYKKSLIYEYVTGKKQV